MEIARAPESLKESAEENTGRVDIAGRSRTIPLDDE